MENHEYEYRLMELEKRIEKIENKVEENDKLLHDFDKTQSLIIQKLDTLMATVESIKAHQEQLTQEPADNWKKIKWTVISCIVTSIIGIIIGYVMG